MTLFIIVVGGFMLLCFLLVVTFVAADRRARRDEKSRQMWTTKVVLESAEFAQFVRLCVDEIERHIEHPQDEWRKLPGDAWVRKLVVFVSLLGDSSLVDALFEKIQQEAKNRGIDVLKGGYAEPPSIMVRSIPTLERVVELLNEENYTIRRILNGTSSTMAHMNMGWVEGRLENGLLSILILSDEFAQSCLCSCIKVKVGESELPRREGCHSILIDRGGWTFESIPWDEKMTFEEAEEEPTAA